ncbi:anti-sigma factor [uncultured Meiothermus sp.]|jgi:anti-sigma-K factor RskA|uniref:anti-sigma factor n=1 Tax=uncultured Meiothermus sp. TaxID=157471 RepID=UPI0026193128|nr:anti-sigma factor [uncultured Meiothermus sp.]
MKDLRELLPDYALGLLEGSEKAQLEQALQSSPELRQELEELQAVLLQIPQSLPPEVPSPSVWVKIKHKTIPRRDFLRWVAAAAVLASLGLGGWGLDHYNRYRTLAEEHARVARWLADPDVRWRLIKNAEGKSLGTMLWTEDGRCLMILSEPPPAGKVYQAWGRKTEGDPVSLGVFTTRVFETSYEGFASVGVSLEPPGGSPQPTQPLGRVPTS